MAAEIQYKSWQPLFSLWPLFQHSTNLLRPKIVLEIFFGWQISEIFGGEDLAVGPIRLCFGVPDFGGGLRSGRLTVWEG